MFAYASAYINIRTYRVISISCLKSDFFRPIFLNHKIPQNFPTVVGCRGRVNVRSRPSGRQPWIPQSGEKIPSLSRSQRLLHTHTQTLENRNQINYLTKLLFNGQSCRGLKKKKHNKIINKTFLHPAARSKLLVRV